MAAAVDDVHAQLARLDAAVAGLAGLAFDELSVDAADAVVEGIESAQRKLSAVGYAAVDRLRADPALGRGRRLRDHLANLLNISATEAGTRIATSADLAGDPPGLPETAAASRYGLIGTEHVRIIRDTIAKLPDNARDVDRARFDLELTGVAVADRPEVLRREAALLLAEYDATHAASLQMGSRLRMRRR